LGDKNLAKISEENDKKSLVEPSQVGEREREKFEKCLKKSNLTFKKHDSRVSIDRKTASVDRNRQRL